MTIMIKAGATLASLLLAASVAFAQSKAPAKGPAVAPEKVDALLKSAFDQAPADWASRLVSDETMAVCSATNNAPSKAQGDKIIAAAMASIKYPADGNLVGDWKKGERIAQSGYGMRFSDYPPANPNGGNCYACHQLTKEEVSYGTIGPSLREYGKIRKFAPADIKAAYEKIYNSHAAFPCSLMPRFGTNGVLDMEQVRDLTALLMSPDSPVNK